MPAQSFFANDSLPRPPANPPDIKLYDYAGGQNIIYEGWAAAGSDVRDPVWAIKRYDYTAGQLTGEVWASADSCYTHVWNNRAALTYA